MVGEPKLQDLRLRVWTFWDLPVVSIVVPFWGYLIGSLLYIWLNQKKGTTMETIGFRVKRAWNLGLEVQGLKAAYASGLRDSILGIRAWVRRIWVSSFGNVKSRGCGLPYPRSGFGGFEFWDIRTWVRCTVDGQNPA